MQGFAGDITRFGTGQKCDCVGDIGRVSEFGQRYLRDQRIALVFTQLTRHVGIDEAGSDRIDADVVVPGRGGVLRGREQIETAIDNTRGFVSAVLEGVRPGLSAGKSAPEIYRDVRTAMDPEFGDWPVYEHCIPFDVVRAMEELSGTEHPTVWTDERDARMWQELVG